MDANVTADDVQVTLTIEDATYIRNALNLMYVNKQDSAYAQHSQLEAFFTYVVARHEVRSGQ